MSNIIGIDVSNASLDCAYLRDPDQKRVKRLRCHIDVSCFASLIAWAEAKSALPITSLAFVIEPTHIYHEQLVQFLYNAGATVTWPIMEGSESLLKASVSRDFFPGVFASYYLDHNDVEALTDQCQHHFKLGSKPGPSLTPNKCVYSGPIIFHSDSKYF